MRLLLHVCNEVAAQYVPDSIGWKASWHVGQTYALAWVGIYHMQWNASNYCSVIPPAKAYAAGAGLRSSCTARFWMALRAMGTTTLPSGHMCQNGRSSYPYHLPLSKPDWLSTAKPQTSLPERNSTDTAAK